MKKSLPHVTFIGAPIGGAILLVLLIAFSGGNDLSLWQILLAIPLALVAVWLVALILNFAIFAPVFWLFGKFQSKQPNRAET